MARKQVDAKELQARINAALALHPNIDGQCYECDDGAGGSVPWPCRTAQALMGDCVQASLMLGYINIRVRKLTHVARVQALGVGLARIETLCGGVHARDVVAQDAFELLHMVRELSTIADGGRIVWAASMAASLMANPPCWRCRREALLSGSRG